MSKMAQAPCIICGKELPNVEMDCENQPYGGTAFSSGGHYGSTAFDPMNGSSLEINFCDLCLVKAGKDGKVLWTRRAKALMHDGSIIGWLSNPIDFYVSWKPELDETSGLRTTEQTDLDYLNVESKKIS